MCHSLSYQGSLFSVSQTAHLLITSFFVCQELFSSFFSKTFRCSLNTSLLADSLFTLHLQAVVNKFLIFEVFYFFKIKRRRRDLNPRAGYLTYTPLGTSSSLSTSPDSGTHNFLCNLRRHFLYLKCIINYTEGISYCQLFFYKNSNYFVLFYSEILFHTFCFSILFHDYHTYLSTFLFPVIKYIHAETLLTASTPTFSCYILFLLYYLFGGFP